MTTVPTERTSHMNEITLTDVRRIMATCAGTDDDARLDGDILDVRFDELGYDSLAIMETVAIIERDHGVRIPDEKITELGTPRALLDMVNHAVATAG
jgi:act minimal PKS acyl carrier protein